MIVPLAKWLACAGHFLFAYLGNRRAPARTVLNGHARITESAKEVVIMTGNADRHSECQRRIYCSVDVLPTFRTTAANPSHLLGMTIYRESRFYQTKRLLEIRHMEKEFSF